MFARELDILLAMIPDRRFGSGSRPKPPDCDSAGQGSAYTRTVNAGMVQWKSPNLSAMSRLSVGRSADPSVDSYNALVFAVR